MEPRTQALYAWVAETRSLANPILQLLPGDASFRRYFRLHEPGGSYIVMDAPPERENCLPYVAISYALRTHGLLAPEVIAQDLSQGFLLLTDFNDRLLLTELTTVNARVLYTRALDVLMVLQSCREVPGWQIQPFTVDFMYKELKHFQEWYLENYLGLTLSATTKNMLECLFLFLVEMAASQPQVFMHRDYHSANLMVLPNDQIGILDFQDAFIGPVTYDLVSLLRDCYIAWPEEWILKLALQYRDQLGITTVSDSEFLRWFDLMGLQRHLKALLTFSRKYLRDENARYLQHIPRTLTYLTQESRSYRECQPFQKFLYDVMVPAQQEMSIVCVE
ncbi:MAG: hypothetical protein K0S27_414 [Gammaproteobacteria bacterium]|jgi:aminoglycoside/choline kinase family phosphotransferase|nr:hypothetical protein [Gammaproteobacteria bacterium]